MTYCFTALAPCSQAHSSADIKWAAQEATGGPGYLDCVMVCCWLVCCGMIAGVVATILASSSMIAPWDTSDSDLKMNSTLIIIPPVAAN